MIMTRQRPHVKKSKKVYNRKAKHPEPKLDRHYVSMMVEEYLAKGGEITKITADGTVNQNSWKDQAKKSWNTRQKKASQCPSG